MTRDEHCVRLSQCKLHICTFILKNMKNKSCLNHARDCSMFSYTAGKTNCLRALVSHTRYGAANVSHTGYMSQDSIDFSCPENLPESQELVCSTFRNKMLMVWSI